MIKLNKFIILIIINLIILFCNDNNVVQSITVGGLYSTPGKWSFITKFCFEDQGGHVIMKLFHSLSKNTKIYLYSDKNKNYNNLLDDIYGDKYSCQEKSSWSNYEFSPFINNPNDFDWESRMQVKSVMQKRDRFWIIAIADCNETSLNSTSVVTNPNKYLAEYVFSLYNEGDHIDSVLSADQQSIPQSQMFFFLLFFILFSTCIVYIVILKRKQLEYKVIAFLAVIIGIHFLANILFLCNWARIIHYDGPELKYANLFGNLFYILGNSLFVCLILMVGQGWTTSIYYGSMIKRIVNNGVSSLLFTFGFIIYVVFVYRAPEYNNYIYFLDTYPGYALLAVYVCIIFYFIIGNHISRVKQNDSKLRKFILVFTCCFSLWLIAQPMIVVVAHFLEPWTKYKVIAILNNIINSIFYILLLILFRPTQGNLVVKILESNDKFGMEIKDYPNNNNKKQQQKDGKIISNF